VIHLSVSGAAAKISDFSTIGKRIALIDSASKTSGQGKYTRRPFLAGNADWEDFAFAHAHARIRKIDFSQAAAWRV